jgi:chorismate mutase
VSTDSDPEIRRLREQLTANDEGIVAAVNARIQLVEQLRRVKQERGLGFRDAAREEWLLQHLVNANGGPLSDDGLRELVAALLDLTKREVERDAAA